MRLLLTIISLFAISILFSSFHDDKKVVYSYESRLPNTSESNCRIVDVSISIQKDKFYAMHMTEGCKNSDLVWTTAYSIGRYYKVRDTFTFQDHSNGTITKFIDKGAYVKQISGYDYFNGKTFRRDDDNVGYGLDIRKLINERPDLQGLCINTVAQKQPYTVDGNYEDGIYSINFHDNKYYELSLYGMKLLHGSYWINRNVIQLTSKNKTTISGFIRDNGEICINDLTVPKMCICFRKPEGYYFQFSRDFFMQPHH